MWTPDKLRGRALVWLLDLRVGAQVWRVATEPIEAPTGEEGATESYRGGLDLDPSFRDQIDLFADTAGERSVPLTIHLDGLQDVVSMQDLGLRLSAATGRLMLYPDGGSDEDVLVWVDGVVLEPEYGSTEEPVTLTLSEEDADAQGLIPDEAAAYTTQTYPGTTGDQDKRGERYPIIIGAPGSATQDGSAPIHANSATFVLAGHAVAATTATLYDEEDDFSESLAITESADALGRVVSWINTTLATTITVTVGDAFWVRWTGGGGLQGPSGSAMRGAGSIMRWMLQRSGARWDAGRTAAAIPRLDSYLIDCYIGATPDKRVSPLEWVREHLVPILPISMRRGPGGLYPVVWRFDAVEQDASGVIDADASRASRVGPVSWSARDAVKNQIVLRYGPSARTDKYTKRKGFCGDPLLPALDTDLETNLACRWSFGSFGSRPLERSSDVLWDDATAGAVLAWWARRYALPTRSATYSVDAVTHGHLSPGDVVVVHDDEVGFVDQVALVDAVLWRTTGDLAISVRTLENPAMEKHR